MQYYWHSTPKWLQLCFPRYTWRRPATSKVLYLTFDDGPHPTLTPWVLRVLAEADARATFFWVGENILRYPQLAQQTVAAGHHVGNHTHHHLRAKKQKTSVYLQNVEQAARAIAPFVKHSHPPFFRPPYGSIRRKTLRSLAPHYEIIMWDVLSGDFDTRLSPDRCLSNTLQATRPGSIVVFHEHEKAQERLQHVLPAYLYQLSTQGYHFEAL